MKEFRRRLIITEIIIANHLGAIGDFWAASAARRLEKFSGEVSSRVSE